MSFDVESIHRRGPDYGAASGRRRMQDRVDERRLVEILDRRWCFGVRMDLFGPGRASLLGAGSLFLAVVVSGQGPEAATPL